jgi:hypothetical protein
MAKPGVCKQQQPRQPDAKSTRDQLGIVGALVQLP